MRLLVCNFILICLDFLVSMVEGALFLCTFLLRHSSLACLMVSVFIMLHELFLPAIFKYSIYLIVYISNNKPMTTKKSDHHDTDLEGVCIQCD